MYKVSSFFYQLDDVVNVDGSHVSNLCLSDNIGIRIAFIEWSIMCLLSPRMFFVAHAHFSKLLIKPLYRIASVNARI